MTKYLTQLPKIYVKSQTDEKSFEQLKNYLLKENSLIDVLFKVKNTQYKNREPSNLFVNAVLDNHNELVEFLLTHFSHLIDVNQKDSLNYPIVFYPVMNHNVKLLEILINFGVDVTQKDVLGKTVLWSLHPSFEEDKSFPKSKLLLDMLLKKGININQKDAVGNTLVLELSTKFNQTPISWIKHLVKCGADIHVVNDYGYNGFLYACWKQNKELIEFFYSLAPNVHAVNYEENGAFELSLQNVFKMNESTQYLLTLKELATIEKLLPLIEKIKTKWLTSDDLVKELEKKIVELEKDNLEKVLNQKENNQKVIKI